MSLIIAELSNNRQNRMDALMGLPTTPYVQNADQILSPEQTVRIGFNYAGIAYENSFYQSLGAKSLSSSMAVIACNEGSGGVGLAHLTHAGNPHALSDAGEEALRLMMTRIGGPLAKVRIVGPNLRGPSVDGFINDVLDVLAEYDAQVLSADFRGKESVHSVAVHAGAWSEGLVRGSVNVFSPLAKGTSGAEMTRRIHEMVNLEGMIHLPNTTGGRIVCSGGDTLEYAHNEPGVF